MSSIKFALAALAILGLCQCSSGEDSEVFGEQTEAAVSVEQAEQAAAEAVEGTTYDGQGQPYGCTSDCSGHDAGYRWADENQIFDPAACGGNSQSFIEGCMAYAEAYQAALEEAR
jgi:hypothetical protein